MKTNTVPSVGCKGNGKVLSVFDGAYNYGATTGSDTFDFYKNAYNKNVGASGLNGGGTGRTGYGIGLVSDASKSGIITDTGTMSAVSSRAIIKY